jgi:hypothetical protein
VLRTVCSIRNVSKKSFTNVALCRVLRKRLHLKAYKLSVVQHPTDADNVVRKEFCMRMFRKLGLLRSVCQEIDYRSAALPTKVTLNRNYSR